MIYIDIFLINICQKYTIDINYLTSKIQLLK